MEDEGGTAVTPQKGQVATQSGETVEEGTPAGTPIPTAETTHENPNPQDATASPDKGSDRRGSTSSNQSDESSKLQPITYKYAALPELA